MKTPIKPMPLWQSTMLFIGPAIALYFIMVFGFEWMHSLGYDYLTTLHTIGLLSFSLILVIALVLYRREGNLFTLNAIKTRFRIKRMDKQAWKITGIAYLVVVGCYLGFLFTRPWIAQFIPMPTWYAGTGEELMMEGAYGLILTRTILVLVNVIGEEFLWRGYILPRQELVHGKHTWWIHGLQWTAFHAFKPWELIMLLPGCLAYGYVCTKTQNTTPGIILHFGLNGLGIIMVTLGVLGVIS